MKKVNVFHYLMVFLVVLALFERSGIPILSLMLNNGALMENATWIDTEKPECEKEKEIRAIEAVYEYIGCNVPDPAFCSVFNYSSRCSHWFTSFHSAVPTPPPDKKA